MPCKKKKAHELTTAETMRKIFHPKIAKRLQAEAKKSKGK